MADPQTRVGGLLGKLLSGDEESERRDMIRRLKRVRDPLERDRIIWALDGQEKGAVGYRPYSDEKRARPLGRQAEEASPPPAQTPSPSTPFKLGNLLNYAIPVIFIFFGISNIGKALDSWAKGGQQEEVLMQLLIGGMFIVFAIIGLFSKKKIRRPAGKPGGGQ